MSPTTTNRPFLSGNIRNKHTLFSPIRKIFRTRFGLITLVAICFGPSVTIADIQVFTDRTAWEAAFAGRQIKTETFNDFSGFTYTVGGVPAFQFPAGLTDVGSLRFDIDRPSGNLIIGGGHSGSIDGTTLWRIEASTQNGSTPPVTPAIIFEQDMYGFGADWNFLSTPRSKMTLGPHTITFSDYMGTELDFLGIITTIPFQRVEFDVVNPFNTLFYADNISYVQSIPEPFCLPLFFAMSCIVVVPRRGRSFIH